MSNINFERRKQKTKEIIEEKCAELKVQSRGIMKVQAE